MPARPTSRLTPGFCGIFPGAEAPKTALAALAIPSTSDKMISVNYCNSMRNVILLNEHSTIMSTPMNPHLRNVAVPNDWDRRGLPGWAYHSPALLELEKEHVFRNHWQIAGHVSDVPERRRLSDHRRGRRAGADRARQGRRGARLPQYVPPSRLARRRRQPGHLQERAGLPVPRLGLQSRRHAARRRAAALVPRSRQDRVRPDAARPRNLDGLHLLPLPARPAAFGGRTAEADRGRARPLSRRRHGAVLGHLDPEDAGQLEVGARRRQ